MVFLLGEKYKNTVSICNYPKPQTKIVNDEYILHSNQFLYYQHINQPIYKYVYKKKASRSRQAS
jgi:hypothetical protein